MAEFLPNVKFQLFTGQIEDNVDPLKLGRVKVRAHGYHSPDVDKIPTADLPWAHVIYNESKRMFVPAIDEWVIGFFLDGVEAQKPIVLGVLPGLDEVEPTTSRWVRNQEVEDTTIYDTKQDTTDTDSITEPVSDYAAEYPHNKTIETSSGHLIEIDDTPGAERIHVYHKSGTFTEIQANGTRVEKNVTDSFDVNLSSKKISVQDTFIVEGSDGSKFELSPSGVTTFSAKEYGVENQAGALFTMSQAGLVHLGNNSQDIKTLLEELISILEQFDTVGSPANHLTGPGAMAKLTVLRTKIALLLE